MNRELPLQGTKTQELIDRYAELHSILLTPDDKVCSGDFAQAKACKHNS